MFCEFLSDETLYDATLTAGMEDENPARTAHLDGLLKRKDEAYTEPEERAAE